jgi:hypothetical protein
MITCHGEDMGAAFQKLLGHRLTPKGEQVDSQFRESGDGRLAGMGPLRCVHACRQDDGILTVSEKIFHETLSHRASADISRADE